MRKAGSRWQASGGGGRGFQVAGLKWDAGLIVAIFMHMAWERLALMYAILVPPVLVLVFVGIMVFESNYTLFTRILFFGAGT